MTTKQERLVHRNAYKFYDNVVYENPDWSKRNIAIASFNAGAKYTLENKHDELKANGKPNIVEFLKDNGVYEMFFANLFNHFQNREEDLRQYFLSNFFAYNAISSAFLWDRTPEGQTFWSEISDRWIKQF